ncbi:MAG: glycoside hydrolase [Opitutus sp.]|nr:glycoside hydrolase [Opitutus sp.]
MHPLRALIILAALTVSTVAHAGDAPPGWPDLTRESKPWARWWWLGSGVDTENLTRELEAIAAAGFGGVEITPIYGAKGFESRFIPFLSPKYIEMLAHVASEAKRLQLGVDMATGTGWPFGGPQVTAVDAELRVAFDAGGKLTPRPSNFKVKRSAPGGEGLVLNPYSATAMTHYLEPITKALSALPHGALRSQFHDSFEYTANWAAEVPGKFQQLHGYDLLEHLAELNSKGAPDTVARIKADYRTTLGALHQDYMNTWIAWAHARGELTRNQAHGSPGNLLDLYAAADIPETEIFGSNEFSIPGFRREAGDFDRPPHPPIVHRFASSAAHVAGRTLASSETFTWLREHFREAPSQMKPEVDQLLLTGINHIFYHGNAYSPGDAPWPGWLFYASTEANTRSPLWRELSSLNQYIARCQAVLQSTLPDSRNEVLVYWPAHDLWHKADGLQRQLTVHATDWLMPSSAGQTAQALVALGVAFDFISDAQLLASRYEANEIRTSGNRYSGLVLVPKTAHMPVETLRQLRSLAASGATIRFLDALPDDVPGYGSLEQRRGQLKGLLTTLDWKGAHFRSAEVQRAKIDNGGHFELMHLAELGESTLPSAVGPTPFLSREPLTDLGLSYVRRKTREGLGHVYFLVNHSGHAVNEWVPLVMSGGKNVTILDPMTGATGTASTRVSPKNYWGASRATREIKEVFLQLAAGESILVRTTPDAAGPRPAWAYLESGGAPIALTGEWRVTFLEGGPALPAPRTMAKLHSWADDPDEAAQVFGGTARYETEITLPPEAKAEDWQLDLGDVRETARVAVNGREVGRNWSLPMRTRISGILRPGKNTLVLEVTSTAANRLRDLDRRGVAWKAFYEINFVNLFYKPFDASKWGLQPCGLLGPVTLTPLRARKL